MAILVAPCGHRRFIRPGAAAVFPSLGFVSILRIVDGLIRAARDYSNPLETAELTKYLG